MRYRDIATFVTTSLSVYGAKKVVLHQVDVNGIFLQNTGFKHAEFADGTIADAVFYPDPSHAFVLEQADRLEGLNLKVNIYGGSANQAWYKVEQCRVNRDHLLENKIDNIELSLKKTRPVDGVS